MASNAIIKQNCTEDGVYNTFNDFRDNKLNSTPFFKMQLEPDSTYRIIFSQENEHIDKNGLVQNIWAVSYKSDLYIPLYGKCFVPLQKMNNSFQFHVPDSLPDMYTMICLGMFSENYGGSRNQGGGFNPDFSGANNLAAFLIVFGAIVVIAITVEIIKTIREAKKHTVSSNLRSIYQGGKIGGMRNCFLDMDTGDVIYH